MFTILPISNKYTFVYLFEIVCWKLAFDYFLIQFYVINIVSTIEALKHKISSSYSI